MCVSNGIVEDDCVALGELASSTATPRNVLEKQARHRTARLTVERQPIGQNRYAEREVHALSKCCRCSDHFQRAGLHCPLDALPNVVRKARIMVCDTALQRLFERAEIRISLLNQIYEASDRLRGRLKRRETLSYLVGKMSGPRGA